MGVERHLKRKTKSEWIKCRAAAFDCLCVSFCFLLCVNEVLQAKVDLSLTLPCHVPLDTVVDLINSLLDITQVSSSECHEITSPHMLHKHGLTFD